MYPSGPNWYGHILNYHFMCRFECDFFDIFEHVSDQNWIYEQNDSDLDQCAMVGDERLKKLILSSTFTPSWF